MSILAVPFIADAATRLMNFMTRFAPEESRAFPELSCRKERVDVPTRHGLVECTVYWPKLGDEERAPVYVNAHGGGFVIGYPAQDDPWCRYLAVKGGLVVVNVDYALAPKHRFPIALEQVYDVLVWAAEPERRWDGTRLCIGGQSAGGNLQAGAARLALDAGGPEILLQVLHYPVLDLATTAAEKPSAVEKPFLRPWMGELFDTAYIVDPVDRRNRFASPAWGENAEGLEGIAPAFVITAELDRLREEGRRYADALERCGALVEYREVPGVDHAYNLSGGREALVREVYDRIVERVGRAVKG